MTNASESFLSSFQGEAVTEVAPSGYEPELGGEWRDAPERTGFEPELGGEVRQKGVYVDEVTCIGCKHCAHVARNTFLYRARLWAIARHPSGWRL